MAIDNNLVNVNSDLDTEQNKRRLWDSDGTKFQFLWVYFQYHIWNKENRQIHIHKTRKSETLIKG